MPVEIYWNDETNPIIGLAAMDNHSSVSMVDPTVIEHFNIPESSRQRISYELSTMHGAKSTHGGSCVAGLKISPLRQFNKRIQLPACIESPLIPEAYYEVAIAKDVEDIPQLRHLQPLLPPERGLEWETLLLLGRNCPQAMVTEEFINGGENMPHAERTPFGWALVGSRNPKKVENKIIAARTHVNIRPNKTRKQKRADRFETAAGGQCEITDGRAC